mgnify:CR=1|jgi:hypothetical protein|tara:strand:+ start:742 stop:951 length:210 start_codon:yes stop_codon:yes gene_type:complete
MVVAPEKVPLTLRFTQERVPVAVPLAASSLELTAVWIAVNSVVNSTPFKTFSGFPLGREFLEVKFVTGV